MQEKHPNTPLEKTPEFLNDLDSSITLWQDGEESNSTEIPKSTLDPVQKEEVRQSKIKEVWKRLRETVQDEVIEPVFRKQKEIIPPIENIKYYPDRMYRCIGENGYIDFLNTGSFRSKDNQTYLDVSFNVGKPAPLYMKKASGDYILEALPGEAHFDFKTHPFHGTPMTNIDYRSIKKDELTKNSKIRIFKKQRDGVDAGKYVVVFDNIGDQALEE